MNAVNVHATLQSPPRALHRGVGKVFTLIAGYRGLVALGLLGLTVGLTLGLLGCDNGGIGGSGQCGGADNSDACVQINTIQPVYLGQMTSNVDAVRDICTPDNPATPVDETVLEPFTDHNAIVTISNSPLPGVGPVADTSVTLQDFSISYTLNSCPASATSCPPLDTLRAVPGQTVTIPPRSSVDITLPFVSLATKSQYVSNGVPSGFPSYTATYIITGTDAFNNRVSVRGSAQFTIGDFNNCPH